MRGAVAGGHRLTAQAGARALEAGGNAVDAAVAAALVSWVAESPLTGPGAGGFMLVHRARDRSTRVLDFFTAVPGLGARGRRADLISVDVDFTRSSTQVFHIGAGSVAVPGAPLGLEEAHRAFGRLPWRELFARPIELAREGVELNRPQAYLHEILDVILRHSKESRVIYEHDGARYTVGENFGIPDLASTFEVLRDGGARDFYHGESARRLVAHVQSQGGVITKRDLAEY